MRRFGQCVISISDTDCCDFRIYANGVLGRNRNCFILSIYLNLLAETGIVGLSAYLIAWGIIVISTLRVMSRTTGFRRGVALGILGAWTHLAVHSVFDKLYVNNMFLHLGVMLGLIGALLAVYLFLTG